MEMDYGYKAYKTDPFFDTTIKQRVLEFLNSHKNRAFSTKEIAEELKMPMASINNALNELNRMKILDATEEGRFKKFSISPKIAKEVGLVYTHMQEIRKYYLAQSAKTVNKDGEGNGYTDN